jgi:hypothetical protein
MNKQILRKYRTLGEYHKLTVPNLSSSESMKFYNQHKEMIDMECIIYSEINESRKKLGSNDKIHKI